MELEEPWIFKYYRQQRLDRLNFASNVLGGISSLANVCIILQPETAVVLGPVGMAANGGSIYFDALANHGVSMSKVAPIVGGQVAGMAYRAGGLSVKASERMGAFVEEYLNQVQ